MARHTESTPKDRTPPHSSQAEMAVLGAMMLDRVAQEKAFSLLISESFYPEKHSVIFQAMQSVSRAGKPLDIITLNDELRRMGKLEAAGGAVYLSELNRCTPTAANIEHHARIVQEKAMKRRMIETAYEVLQDAYDEGSDAFLLLEKAEKGLFGIAESNTRGGYVPISALTQEQTDWIDRQRELYRQGIVVSGTPTGLKDLDTRTGGMQPGDLVILAARPGMGKTAFAMNVTHHVAVEQNTPVGWFSLEMTNLQLHRRCLSFVARVDNARIRDGSISDAERGALELAMEELHTAPIYLDDTPELSMFEIMNRARAMKRKEGIGLLVVDYLQMVQEHDAKRGSKESENRAQAVERIAKSLKAVAKDLGIPVLALAQLNRGLENRTNKRPTLSDLRDSGGIEEAADMVWFLYRDEYYGNDYDQNGNTVKGVAEVSVAKFRNGVTGTEKLCFDGRYTLFGDLAKQGQRGFDPYAFAANDTANSFLNGVA